MIMASPAVKGNEKGKRRKERKREGEEGTVADDDCIASDWQLTSERLSHPIGFDDSLIEFHHFWDASKDSPGGEAGPGGGWVEVTEGRGEDAIVWEDRSI